MLFRSMVFYEDFPYAFWEDFGSLADLPGGGLALPAGVSLQAELADVSDQLERKIRGIAHDPERRRCLELGRPLYVVHRPVQMRTVAMLERLLMPFADDAGQPRYVVAYTEPYALTGEVPEQTTSRMS